MSAPPPPPGPPPPPPPSASSNKTNNSSTSTIPANRGALLASIEGFGKNKLKKTNTVDKSAVPGAGNVVGSNTTPSSGRVPPPISTQSTSPNTSKRSSGVSDLASKLSNTLNFGSSTNTGNHNKVSPRNTIKPSPSQQIVPPPAPIQHVSAVPPPLLSTTVPNNIISPNSSPSSNSPAPPSRPVKPQSIGGMSQSMINSINSSSTTRSVPSHTSQLSGNWLIAKHLIDSLQQRAAFESEVFRRVPDNQIRCTQLIQLLTANQSSIQLQSYDVHTVAKVLKDWLKQHDSIFPPTLNDMFVNAYESNHNDNDRIASLHNIIDKLPNDNKSILLSLCKLVTVIVANTSVTKMTESSLAYSLSPALFKLPNLLGTSTTNDEQMQQMMKFPKQTNALLEFIFKYSKQILSNDSNINTNQSSFNNSTTIPSAMSTGSPSRHTPYHSAHHSQEMNQLRPPPISTNSTTTTTNTLSSEPAAPLPISAVSGQTKSNSAVFTQHNASNSATIHNSPTMDEHNQLTTITSDTKTAPPLPQKPSRPVPPPFIFKTQSTPVPHMATTNNYNNNTTVPIPPPTTTTTPTSRPPPPPANNTVPPPAPINTQTKSSSIPPPPPQSSIIPPTPAQNNISVPPPAPSINSTMKSSVPIAPPPSSNNAVPPPPPQPGPPSAPSPPSTAPTIKKSVSSSSGGDRGALLASIEGFGKNKLKKTTTADKSAVPGAGNVSGTNSSSTSSSSTSKVPPPVNTGGLGGLFAGGFPTLKKTAPNTAKSDTSDGWD